MRVRIYLTAHKSWQVESKRWHNIFWQYEASFSGDAAYERAKEYAQRLKNPNYEEIR